MSIMPLIHASEVAEAAGEEEQWKKFGGGGMTMNVHANPLSEEKETVELEDTCDPDTRYAHIWTCDHNICPHMVIRRDMV